MDGCTGADALDIGLRAKLTRVAEMTPSAVVLSDASGRIEWVNEEFAKLTEITSEEARGLAPIDLQLSPEATPEVLAAIARATAAHENLRTEMRICSRSGRRFWIDLDLRPMFTETGRFDGYMGFWVEVTSAKALELRLERKSAALRSASQLARVGGWELDLVTGIAHWSAEMCEIMGVLEDSSPLEDVLARHDPATRAIAQAQLTRAIETGERMEFRAMATNAAGEPIWMKMFGEPVFVDGRCIAVRGATQDITAEHLAEQRLQQSEGFAQSVIDGITSAITVLDEHGVVIAANKICHQTAAAEGMPAGFPMGYNLEDLLRDVPRRYAGAMRRGVGSVLYGGAAEFKGTFKKGLARDLQWLQVRATRFEWDGASRCLLFIDSIDDVKRREQRLRDLNARLRKARQSADAANAAKSSFLATMSHEIRTPLNAVLGMAQAMAHDDLPPVQRGRLDIVRQAGASLLGLLNDLLDLSKVEAGKLELEDAVVDMTEIATNVQAAFVALADGKDIQLRLTVAPEAGGYWRGDPNRVRQVVYNLVGNAVKFTEHGGVDLDVAHDGNGLVIRVSDSGPGIPEDRRAKLFEKFIQADASTTRRYGGSGLGLAICRDLVGLMKGAITLDSVEGRGSTFTVRLPLPRAEQPPVQPVTAGGKPGRHASAPALRVLVAEDNPMNQLVLKTLMAQVGIEPHVVDNGEQALRAWEQGRWDVILMDVQMPVMDGPTAARRIRERERDKGRARTPIIALTANAMSHHTAMYLAAGMDALAAKPIDFQQLLATIEELLDADPQASPAVRHSLG